MPLATLVFALVTFDEKLEINYDQVENRTTVSTGRMVIQGAKGHSIRFEFKRKGEEFRPIEPGTNVKITLTFASGKRSVAQLMDGDPLWFNKQRPIVRWGEDPVRFEGVYAFRSARTYRGGKLSSDNSASNDTLSADVSPKRAVEISKAPAVFFKFAAWRLGRPAVDIEGHLDEKVMERLRLFAAELERTK